MAIVAAIDRSDRTSTVVEEAATLADAFDDTLYVVHVLTQSDFVDLGRTAAESRESVSMDDIREVAENIASEAAADVDVSAESVGLVGDPADRIVAYAEDQDARYIVVAPRKRSPTGKAMFGSVAQSILLNARPPVVTTVEQ